MTLIRPELIRFTPRRAVWLSVGPAKSGRQTMGLAVSVGSFGVVVLWRA